MCVSICVAMQNRPSSRAVCFFYGLERQKPVLLSSIDPATAADESDPVEVTALFSQIQNWPQQSSPLSFQALPSIAVRESISAHHIALQKTICLIFTGIIPFLFPVWQKQKVSQT